MRLLKTKFRRTIGTEVAKVKDRKLIKEFYGYSLHDIFSVYDPQDAHIDSGDRQLCRDVLEPYPGFFDQFLLPSWRKVVHRW